MKKGGRIRKKTGEISFENGYVRKKKWRKRLP